MSTATALQPRGQGLHIFNLLKLISVWHIIGTWYMSVNVLLKDEAKLFFRCSAKSENYDFFFNWCLLISFMVVLWTKCMATERRVTNAVPGGHGPLDILLYHGKSLPGFQLESLVLKSFPYLRDNNSSVFSSSSFWVFFMHCIIGD